MSVEEEDPLDGYGLWDDPSVRPEEIIKSTFADYDPTDPYGEYDEDHPFELIHHLRNTVNQHRRISKFSTLDDAIVAGQILSLLLPREYDEESDWHHDPMLEVRVRSGNRWNTKYNCRDRNGLVAAMLDGLKRANAEFRDIEERFVADQKAADLLRKNREKRRRSLVGDQRR